VIFNRKYTLEVFDTIQPEDHSVMHEIAIRKCQGAMFCCNSSRDSVYALETYIKMFTRIKDEDALNLPMVIAICKSDQEEAPLEEVNTIAEEYHIKHVFVTSALEGTNVKEAFERLTLLTVDPLEMHLDWVTRFENRKRIVDTGKKNCTLT
jgi:GTPase SAR1 family protein